MDDYSYGRIVTLNFLAFGFCDLIASSNQDINFNLVSLGSINSWTEKFSDLGKGEDLLANNSWDLFCENYRSKCEDLKDKLRFGSSNSIKILGDNQRDFDDISNLYECDQSAERILEIIRT